MRLDEQLTSEFNDAKASLLTRLTECNQTSVQLWREATRGPPYGTLFLEAGDNFNSVVLMQGGPSFAATPTSFVHMYALHFFPGEAKRENDLALQDVRDLDARFLESLLQENADTALREGIQILNKAYDAITRA